MFSNQHGDEKMNGLKLKLGDILSRRLERSKEVDVALGKWNAYQADVDNALTIVELAERMNSDIHGASARLRSVSENIRRIVSAYNTVRARFSRDTLCIGIGGAARMGKSTFLQSVTGLGETQIPTSDKYFTTATRSQIENCPSESVAIVDFHSETSFLAKVIGPMCDAIGLSRPLTLAAFRSAVLELPDESGRPAQGARDVLHRLLDARSELPGFERYLTGERGVRIPLSDLRPFVAYPEPRNDRIVKAGPYLAVADIVIRVPFPSTDVSQLRVVDLPGLGEAGRNLAKVQTEGMEDICDITLLMKRPNDANVEWTETDTNALDAMGDAVPLLDDLTKYTAILANVGSESAERARLCIAAIRNEVKRPFEIIACDARNREAVVVDTMPRILDFLARNLPAIDESILSRLTERAEKTFAALRRDVREVSDVIRQVSPAGTGNFDFARSIKEEVTDVLTNQERLAKERATGNDKEWNAEVDRIHAAVKKWIEDGCGYGSRENLQEAIRKEIASRLDAPDVINDCRNKFRMEWEAMDLHLSNRIAQLLGTTMDALQGVLHGFIPNRDSTLDPLAAVRAQILAFADRIDARHTDIGDDIALGELSRPLRRIADFDLQFRFHLEPMLHATTNLLVLKELPRVKDQTEANVLTEALMDKLLEAANAYAGGMCKSGTGNGAALERKKKLFERAIPDASVRADVVAMLEQSMGSAQSFCPNRIFAAVMETFADAFIRSRDTQKAFQILVREWKSELLPAPDEKTRLTNAAAGVMADLVKKF